MYVQHRLRERASEVNALLQQGASFYVCGDAMNMAREVNLVVGRIISEHRGLPQAKVEEIVKYMRATAQYQVSLATLLSAPYESVIRRPRAALGSASRISSAMSFHLTHANHVFPIRRMSGPESNPINAV